MSSNFFLQLSDDEGMTTIEYAMGALAAAALAGALYMVASSGAVAEGIESIIGNALNQVPA
ncbi:DUF4244 domain-containing protein [Corynebacterium sp. ES2794-CONJ1]|uniref:DUF4244 domain-containing protein n=1 Tax=unclassified Corynebacterium TaxID=2624378 RepID=UPI0021671EE5|nr:MULTISPECIES: DUF4244 domain-containing protein [unclassified Corynebacterium]MCS4490106.1 DUF4244 domain-containing protein [Corynebacterium sp. ES2775-CONJ]MCS4492085.1 DUF4244 domain-containing protein [Corynebacterium sp. ES2715-CONJ3]MCS4532193.1 DUF4244 domain-containing protein [Corynebacterium sp. ES2730-CONJ]MCU9519589.1 DUF4244 domain-containing protein [Corynebacterium sp. ES2794-CONJ1]